jgi:hypothetical protein
MRIERKQVGDNLFKQELIQGFYNQQVFKEYKKVQRRIQKLIRRKRNHSNCSDKTSNKKEKSRNLKKVQAQINTKKSYKYQIFNPKKSTNQCTNSGKRSLQDRLKKLSRKGHKTPKHSLNQGHKAL